MRSRMTAKKHQSETAERRQHDGSQARSAGGSAKAKERLWSRITLLIICAPRPECRTERSSSTRVEKLKHYNRNPGEISS